MNNDYTENDYLEVHDLLNYPESLKNNLNYFDDTSEISVPDDPIEKVIFQSKAKNAIRKIAQNKGHMLMVGRPGTGKSLLANMFQEVLDISLGDYIRPKEAIVAYPGKDDNHVRFAYGVPETIDRQIEKITENIEIAKNNIEPFSLKEQIQSVLKLRNILLALSIISIAVGIFFPSGLCYNRSDRYRCNLYVHAGEQSHGTGKNSAGESGRTKK